MRKAAYHGRRSEASSPSSLGAGVFASGIFGGSSIPGLHPSSGPVNPLLAIGVIFALLVIMAVALATCASSASQSAAEEPDVRTVEGMPPYITYDMVEEALACQEEFGHPAGATLAQIILESGQNDHLSRLAAEDHNLFGMKWSPSFAGSPEVTGSSVWETQEEYDGNLTTVSDTFTSFASDRDCIRFRSRVFLQNSRYKDNPLIAEAIILGNSDKMAEGLKDAGWATASGYTDALKAVMDAYDLRKYDTMTVADFLAQQEGA